MNDYDEDRFGNVLLMFADTTKTVYLQGDDAASFLAEIDTIDRIWSRRSGKGYRHAVWFYKSRGAHISDIIDQYSEIAE